MIDEIFTIRFVEEIERIINVKERLTRLRLRFFALLSYILAFISTLGAVEAIIKAFTAPGGVNHVHLIVVIIVSGFAITFLLTFSIFVFAYLKVEMIKRCLGGFSFSVDSNKVASGENLAVDLSFILKKRDIEGLKLKLTCVKDTQQKVLDLLSVKKSRPHEKEINIAQGLKPREEEYNYHIDIDIPGDALKSQPLLSLDKEKVAWGVSVHFDFVDWYSHEEYLPITVV